MIMKDSKSMTKDPVCGMTVDEATALHVERDGKMFFAATTVSASFCPPLPVPDRKVSLVAVVDKVRLSGSK